MNDVLSNGDLNESEERYRAVMEAIPDPVVVYDMEGRVTYLNPSFTSVFGWTLEERIGKKLDDFVPEKNWPETHKMIDMVLSGKKFMAIESERYDKAGNLIPVSISGANFRNKAGELIGSVINLQNITKRKRAEIKLEQSHDILNSILSASPTGIGMIENYAFKWVNRAVTDMFGFENSEAYENQPIEMVFSSPNDFEFIKKNSCEQFKNGEVVKYDTTFRRQDGSIFIGHLKMSTVDSARPEERIIFAITDITWRRIAESDLESSQQRYRGVFENTGTAMIIINEEGFISMANNMFEALTGFTKAEIENKMKWEDYVASDDLDRLREHWYKHQEGQKAPSEYEFKLLNKQKKPRDILLKVGVLPTTKQVVASLTDISSRKKMELKIKETNRALNQSLTTLKHAQAQLVESEKMAALGGLVAGVAHEINTPIGVAITAASFLEIKTKKHKEAYKEGTLSRSLFEKFMDGVSEASSIIHSNLKRAAELVNSFKQVAVDQSSEGRRKFNLRAYIDEILLSLGPKFKRTLHRIDINCPDDLEIDSYPGAFYQIITNLLMNSLLHGFENIEEGHIVFEIDQSDQYLKFTYRDNGAGMKPGQVKKIFDPFFTTKRGQGGSGLGMHIVYNLVNQTLNGQIECHSAPGEGLRCQIKIPIGDAEP